MCAVSLYYDLYNRHAGECTAYHNWRVRMARALIRQHEATCPECRGRGRSNWNVAKPRTGGFMPRRPK